MKRQTIAIDIDNVLAVHASEVIDFYNTTYGTNHLVEDYDEQWSWMGSLERIEDFRPKFQTSGLHAGMAPIKGAKEALKKLKNNYDLAIITARWQQVAPPTMLWVESQFPGLINGVHFAQTWQLDRSEKVSKADICKQINANILIDDNISHCTIAAEAGIECILFGDYVWNEADKLPKNVTRCNDWSAVMKYFDGRD